MSASSRAISASEEQHLFLVLDIDGTLLDFLQPDFLSARIVAFAKKHPEIEGFYLETARSIISATQWECELLFTSTKPTDEEKLALKTGQVLVFVAENNSGLAYLFKKTSDAPPIEGQVAPQEYFYVEWIRGLYNTEIFYAEFMQAIQKPESIISASAKEAFFELLNSRHQLDMGCAVIFYDKCHRIVLDQKKSRNNIDFANFLIHRIAENFAKATGLPCLGISTSDDYKIDHISNDPAEQCGHYFPRVFLPVEQEIVRLNEGNVTPHLIYPKLETPLKLTNWETLGQATNTKNHQHDQIIPHARKRFPNGVLVFLNIEDCYELCEKTGALDLRRHPNVSYKCFHHQHSDKHPLDIHQPSFHVTSVGVAASAVASTAQIMQQMQISPSTVISAVTTPVADLSITAAAVSSLQAQLPTTVPAIDTDFTLELSDAFGCSIS